MVSSDASSIAAHILLPLQTVLRTGIDTKALAEQGSPRVRQLAEIAVAYQFRLRRQGLMDPEEVLWQASLLEPRPRSLFIYGYFRSRAEELAFVNAIAGEGSKFLLPCANHSIFAANREGLEFLERYGWITETPQPSSRAIGEVLSQRFIGEALEQDSRCIKAHEYPDLDAEVRAALTEVKQLLASGVSADEIVLVARDAHAYGPKVLSVGWEYGIAVRPSYRVPLSETRFGAWFMLALNAIREDFPFEETLRFIVHPLGPEPEAEVWREARRRHPNGLAEWAALGVDLAALAWAEEETRGNWIKRVQSSLQALEIRRKAGSSARDLLALQCLLDELRAITRDLDEVISRDAFIEELFECLATLTVAAQPGIGGIRLYEPHLLIGAKYQYVFVLGMADGILPGTVTENPIVDFYERKRLLKYGLEFEDAAAVARWEALSFYFLLETCTGKPYLSFPRLIGDQGQLPSPYFGRLGVKPIDGRLTLEVACSPEEVRRAILRAADGLGEDPVLAPARFAFKVESGREAPGQYDEWDGATGISLDPLGRQWSASQLSRLGQCPFSWFLQRLLALRVVEEPETELSPLTKGLLYHKTLELALKRAAETGADLQESALANLSEAFSQAETDSEVGLPTLTAWDAQRLEHLAILRRAIESANFLEPGARVLDLERQFEGYWYGLRVTGKLDRIDETSEGLTLIDYKAGSSVSTLAKDDQGRASVDIQLPLYIDVAAKALHPGKTVKGAYYYSLSKAKVIKKVDHDALSSLEPLADRIKAHVMEGYYPVEPDVDQSACKYCDYDEVCRKGYRLSRKGGNLNGAN
jgi:RecB family exonuclease